MDYFKDYQEAARATAIYAEAVERLETDEMRSLLNLSYATLGLTGEAGEFANKVKKMIRDRVSSHNHFKNAELAMELGDILWYVAAAAHEIGYDLAKIAEINVQKLAEREQRGTIQGSGDER